MVESLRMAAEDRPRRPLLRAEISKQHFFAAPPAPSICPKKTLSSSKLICTAQKQSYQKVNGPGSACSEIESQWALLFD
jgi:hypothetical protein